MGRYNDRIMATSGLVSYWRLGEPVASTFVGDSKGSNNGSYINTPTLGITGALYEDADKAVSFNTPYQAEYASIPYNPTLDLADSWTVTCWIKPETVQSGAPRVILSKGDNAYNFRLATDGRLNMVRANDAVLIDSATNVSAGVWQHVACVKNGNDRRLYINGIDYTSSNVLNTSITENNTSPLYIGVDPLPGGGFREYFGGGIDEVALFNRALGSTEIWLQYKAGLALPGPRQGLQRLTGGAIIEIRDGYLGTWSAITCEIVSARTVWGSLSNDGLLTNAKGGLLECEYYDPDRTLDPSNRKGPYYSILKPGLWMKLSYSDGASTTVVGQGRVDAIDYNIGSRGGRIRANDWVSWFANMQYPNDIMGTLPNWTSYGDAHAFATALINRINTVTQGSPDYFQVPVTVEAGHGPVFITPVEPPFALAQPGPTIWQQFVDMTENGLYFAYIDRNNYLRFRSLLSPYSYGSITLDLTGPQVIDFASTINAAGVYNYIVNFGKTNYVQDRPSVDNWGQKMYQMARAWLPQTNQWMPPNDTEWMTLVLRDRSRPSLDVMPLQVWPATAQELKNIINLQAMDLVRMDFNAVDPPIELGGRLMGGQISVTAEGWSAELVCWMRPEDALEKNDD